MKTTEKPTLQDFQIEGVKHIAPQDALDAVRRGEAVLLDVREENEWKIETISLYYVYYQPMSVIMERLSYIPRDKAIITVSQSGERGTRVANLLNANGFACVANLDGGFREWKSAGLPIDHKLSFGCSCGCR